MAVSKAEKLSQEIIFDILSRLPAKPIGQFRCVSKHWCSLLSDPLFIKTHLIHSRKQQEKLIVISEASTLHSITFNQNENGILSGEINFRHLSDKWITIGGSCNGLVLVVTKDDVKFLINPTTLKYHKIPDFHMALPVQDSFIMYGLGYDFVSDDFKVVTQDSFIMYGLGYDFVSDDFKVVTLSYYNTENDCGPDIFDTFVDVYSARNRTWKRIGSSPYIHQIPRLASGVLVNGALHWLASSNTSCVIAAFDLSDEKFLEVPAPSVFDEVIFVFNKLVALRGCLCMFTDNINRDGIDVWMMKDYGVKESWTKFEVIGLDSGGDLIPLCLISEDDVVLDADGELIVYHTREDKWSLMDDGIPTLGEDTGTGTFRETLVSPTYEA